MNIGATQYIGMQLNYYPSFIVTSPPPSLHNFSFSHPAAEAIHLAHGNNARCARLAIGNVFANSPPPPTLRSDQNFPLAELPKKTRDTHTSRGSGLTFWTFPGTQGCCGGIFVALLASRSGSGLCAYCTHTSTHTHTHTHYTCTLTDSRKRK